MQNPYNYVFDDITQTYNFTTKNKILYRVAFIVDETFSTISNEDIHNVYQIIIEKAHDDIEPYDSKVYRTIEDIIERFFRNVDNSLIYICSDDDEKAKLRHKIFDRWYKKSKYRKSIMKIDNIIKIKLNEKIESKVYTSFIFHKANSNFEKLWYITEYGEKNDLDHEVLALAHRAKIIQILTDFNPSLTNTELEALSWLGLEDTIPYTIACLNNPDLVLQMEQIQNLLKNDPIESCN